MFVQHLESALAAIDQKLNDIGFTAARNRLNAYRRYKSEEDDHIELDTARRLMTKGNDCSECVDWNGED